MAELSSWEWWIGHEGQWLFDLGCAGSRDEAIRAGLRETTFGQRFQIVEARCRIVDSDGSMEEVPFAETRNHEVFTNTAELKAHYA